jgi:phospholipid/cholesterol/gamma-HCH transport system substrate-binding protein
MFVFAALMALFAAVFLIGDRQLLFSSTYRLKSEFASVSGLLAGAEVRVGGIRKGSVEEIRLPESPTGKITVTMSLDRETLGLVKKDSIAAIETEGLLGNKFVAVSFGTEAAPGVRSGDTIASQPPLDLSDLIRKTNELMDTTHSALKNVDVATAQIAMLTSRVNRGDGTVGALLNDRKLYDNLNSTVADAKGTMAQAKTGMTAFQENMQALKRSFFFRGFFKDRGYSDPADLTKHEIARVPSATPLRKFVYDARDVFEKPDSVKLKNRKIFNELGDTLEKDRYGLVLVSAYSGLAGDRDANLVLTQAQAMVVRDYLADKFELDDTRLKTKGMGETKPEPGKDHWIEISLYPETAKSAAAHKQS